MSISAFFSKYLACANKHLNSDGSAVSDPKTATRARVDVTLASRVQGRTLVVINSTTRQNFLEAGVHLERKVTLQRINYTHSYLPNRKQVRQPRAVER